MQAFLENKLKEMQAALMQQIAGTVRAMLQQQQQQPPAQPPPLGRQAGHPPGFPGPPLWQQFGQR